MKQHEKLLKDVHEKLGEIVHNQAVIEHGLAVWVANLIEVDNEIGLILTVELPFKLRIQALLNVFEFQSKQHLKLKDYKERVDELIKMMRKVESIRNQFAHSSFLSLDGDAFYVRAKYQAKEKNLKLVWDNFQLNDLDELIKEQHEIRKLHSELFQITRDIVAKSHRQITRAKKSI